MDLSKIPTRDLVDALQGRDEAQYVINDRSSSNFAVSIDKGDLLVDKGEAIILVVKGLY